MKTIEQLKAAVQATQNEMAAAVIRANDLALAPLKNARQMKLANDADKHAAVLIKKHEAAIDELTAAQTN